MLCIFKYLISFLFPINLCYLICYNCVNNYKKPILNSISNYLNINYINISSEYNLKTDLSFNKSKYSNYVTDFITSERDNKILFSIKVYNYIKNNYN